jgi:hypothetical protein
MAGVTGLEPATSGVTGQHSNQLSYTPSNRARLRQRDRPCQEDWEKFDRRDAFRSSFPINNEAVLGKANPLVAEMVGGDGIEPPTYWV